jgi:tripartite-type tricarboxylate transporter receptor subunit TctC
MVADHQGRRHQGAVREGGDVRMLVAALAWAFAVAASAAGAQEFPSRPITIIAPTTAGGPPDTIARLLSERMRVVLGQPVIVENVTGAGSTIGLARVARASPDGYMLSIGHLNSHVFSSLTYNTTYDVLKDFAPVAMLTRAPMLFIARSGFPPNDLKELIAWLKANPAGASFGAVGVGGPATVWGTDFKTRNSVQFQFVPYRGAAAIMQDLVAGQIDLACTEASNVLPHLRSGKVKAYAVLARDRWSVVPEVPPIDEAVGFTMTFWHGIWVPKGTPPEAIKRLNAAVMDALSDGVVRARLAQMGQEIVPREQQSPEALGAHHKSEIEKWLPVIKAAGIKMQ